MQQINYKDYQYILSVKHKDKIDGLCLKLKSIGSIDRICLCVILPLGDKIFLSNMPNWAIKYHAIGAPRGDEVFNLSTYKNEDYFFPRKSMYDEIQHNLVEMEEKFFGHYDTFSIARKSKDCSFVFLAAHDKPIEDVQPFYEKWVKKFELFCIHFIDGLIDVILAKNHLCENLFIFKNKNFRDYIITNKFAENTKKLNHKKQEILRLLVLRKSIKDISMRIPSIIPPRI